MQTARLGDGRRGKRERERERERVYKQQEGKRGFTCGGDAWFLKLPYVMVKEGN